jgi:hypothetical protein
VTRIDDTFQAAGPRAAAGARAASRRPPAYGLNFLDRDASGPAQLKAGTANAHAAGPTATAGLPARLRSGVEHLSGVAMDDVKVHYGSSAPAQIGALAFTRGAEIHVAPGQEQHLAHEAWHVVQQKQGRVAETTQRKGIGVNADTALEREADVMGARAVAQPDDHAAAPLSRAAVTAPTVQCYVEKDEPDQDTDDWDAGEDLRISDDGNMAVEQASKYGSKYLYAKSALIDSANQELRDVGSVIRLKAGGTTLKGPSPDGNGNRTLSRVIARNIVTNTEGNDLEIWADCGRSGRDVMGAGGGTGGGNMTGVYKKKHGFLGTLFNADTTRKTSASGPKAMAKEIYDKLGGRDAYDNLSANEKDAFDQEARINRYAEPGVGEGFTMASGGANYKGKSTWNFHWGGVIMVSGGDRVTLENYAVGDASVKNKEWDFQMYGPATKAGQTFHDQHKATKQHGNAPTTIHVRKR